MSNMAVRSKGKKEERTKELCGRKVQVARE
jgi:hypothetical protein